MLFIIIKIYETFLELQTLADHISTIKNAVLLRGKELTCYFVSGHFLALYEGGTALEDNPKTYTAEVAKLQIEKDYRGQFHRQGALHTPSKATKRALIVTVTKITSFCSQ